MKRILKTFISAVISFMLIFSVFSIAASAATGTISLGYSGKANPGQTITVNLTVGHTKSMFSYDTLITYDKDCLKLVSLKNSNNEVVANAAGSFKISLFNPSGAKNLTETITFKVLKVGNTQIAVGSSQAGDVDGQAVDIPAKNLNISITAPTKSSDNTLKKITISAGTLSPSFSPNVTEYKVTVPYNVDYFDINGVPNHDKATRTYSKGENGPDIKVGTTVRTITVTAENGSVRKYNITVTRLPQGTTSSTSSADTSSTTSTVEPEENKLETVVDGNKMTVAEIIPDDVTAAGFEKGEYTFNSVHVPAFLDKDKEVVLLYLLDEENKGELYMYNPATGIFSPPCFVNDARNYTILPVSAIKRDQLLIDTENVFNLSTVTIGQQQVEAYIYKDDALADFAIVCAINEKGEKGFYRYDIAEGTLQRYVAESKENSPAGAVVSGLANTDTIVVIVCAAVCLAAIIAIIIIWAARRRYYDEEDFDDFDDAEPLFVKETEFDTAETDENLMENENEDETEENDGETESEEE